MEGLLARIEVIRTLISIVGRGADLLPGVGVYDGVPRQQVMLSKILLAELTYKCDD